MLCSVPVVQLDSVEEFHSTVYPTRRPTILRGISLGSAPSLWTPSYLAEKCGGLPVKVHVSPVPQMDFIKKNFVYRQVSSTCAYNEPLSLFFFCFCLFFSRTLPFDEFVQRASQEKQTDYFLNPASEAGLAVGHRALEGRRVGDVLAECRHQWSQQCSNLLLASSLLSSLSSGNLKAAPQSDLQEVYYTCMHSIMIPHQSPYRRRNITFVP